MNFPTVMKMLIHKICDKFIFQSFEILYYFLPLSVILMKGNQGVLTSLKGIIFVSFGHIPMVLCKTAVIPLLLPWSYRSLVLSHQYYLNASLHNTRNYVLTADSLSLLLMSLLI